MRSRSIVAIGASLIFVFSAAAGGSAPTTLQKSPQTGAAQPVVMHAADLKWTDLDPKGAPGVKIADLWGDHTKGPFGAFLRLPAGFTAPLHTHTHDMRLVFVSGTYLQTPEGGAEMRFSRGSYLMQPGGNYRHVTSCDKAADCVFFFESEGAFDLKVVE